MSAEAADSGSNAKLPSVFPTASTTPCGVVESS
eukprot:CAMPEP_0176129240 /NCGR_PEP_ID=MMETSP0120_2-20121206/65341_1 /TAXON_ID=160619 /ORGANISM="Kryptoperidinium foliaceum, Strain CCMP 1326" /LENGTH=32 /DNA_ID= /DNA_START= /DNA_END= /DNA_ORIENTATION=